MVLGLHAPVFHLCTSGMEMSLNELPAMEAIVCILGKEKNKRGNIGRIRQKIGNW